MNDLYLYSVSGNLPRHGCTARETGNVWSIFPRSHDRFGNLAGDPSERQKQAVFVNRSGKRLTVTGIQLQLAMYCQRAVIWVTCHQLRHTFGRSFGRLVNASMDAIC